MIDQVPSDNATYGLCVKGFGGNYYFGGPTGYESIGSGIPAVKTTGTFGNLEFWQNYSIKIYTDGKLATQSILAFSDRRIKNNIIEINDQSALDSLRLLKPCTYNYKDVIDRGYGKVTGFIAQEVHDVLPNSVDLITSEIPNIYKYGIFKVIDDENAEILC